MIRFSLLLGFIIAIGTGEVSSQTVNHLTQTSSASSMFLRSKATYQGNSNWQMKRAEGNSTNGKAISSVQYPLSGWQTAIVPGTVLNSLVANKVYPDPYFGDNNRRSRKLIPDIADAGSEFYSI